MTHAGRLDDETKIFKITEFKGKGNTFYREGNFKQAAKSYYRSILYIKGLSIYSHELTASLQSTLGDGSTPSKPAELDADTKKLICDCYSNLAACMLKESEPKFDRIIDFCDKALEVSPSNVKALYRKGSSQYACGNYDEALKTLEKAQPDASVRKLIEQCKIGIKKEEKELMSRYKGMFKS